MSAYIEYDYDSDEDFYELDGDYIWAEDSWELADELASGAVPDPPALYYRDDEFGEHDKYDFWSELEYGNGEIYDGECALEEPDRGQQGVKAGDKRKRSDHIKDQAKKIRLAGICEYPPVVWKPSTETFALRQECPLFKKPRKPYALLPDWRQRFNGSNEEDQDHRNRKSEDEENGDWEDESEEDAEQGQQEEDEEEGEGENGDDMDIEDIDPDMLKSALAARLSSSGLAGADHAAFTETLMQMLSGGGANTDDMLETLTSTLLDQASQGGATSATAQWLSGQGVSLDQHDDEDEEDQNDSSANATTRTLTDASPQDSADPGHLITEEPPAVPKTTGTKRKQVSFENSGQKASADVEAAVLDPAPTSKRSKGTTNNTQTPASTAVARAKSTTLQNRNTKTSRETNHSKPTRSQTKTTKTDVSEASQAPEPPKPAMSQAKVSKVEEPPPKSEQAMEQTRKRKAPTETVVEERPKRRNFAAPTASSQSKSAETKTTRSGRTRK